jgi:hypothetical protein
MRNLILSVVASVALFGCSTGAAIPVTTSTPVATSAQVASKVANCVAGSGASCPAGTAPQLCLALAAMQCSQGY